MLDLINWYAVELKLRLSPHFSTERVDTIVREASGHLEESAKNIRDAKHLEESQAIVEAIEAFGSPAAVAQSYLRESNPRVMGLRPIWVVLTCAFIATVCWNFQWTSMHGFFDTFGETWKNPIVALIGLIALGIMAKACRAGYRSYRFPLIALSGLMALGSMLFLSFWIVGSDGWQGISRFHMSRDVAQVQKTVVNLGALEKYIHDGSVAMARAKSYDELPYDLRNPHGVETEVGMEPGSLSHMVDSSELSSNTHLIIVPGFVMAAVDGRIWGPQAIVATLGDAKKRWLDNSQVALVSLQSQRSALEGLLKSADDASRGRMFFFNRDVYGETVTMTLAFAPILLLVDWLVVMAFRRKYPKVRALA